MEQRYVLASQLVFQPSGPRIREALSYDLPLLWPLEYARTIGLFKYAPREDRLRFLTRVGVRFVVMATPPFAGAKPLARLVGVEQMQLYDFNPGARRAYIVPDALMGPDIIWQIQGLFQPRFDPSSGVQAVVAGPGWAIDPRWHAVVDAHASPPYRRASVGAVRLSSMWRRNRTDVPDPSRSGVERMASLSERWTQQPSASGSTAAAGSPTAAR